MVGDGSRMRGSSHALGLGLTTFMFIRALWWERLVGGGRSGVKAPILFSLRAAAGPWLTAGREGQKQKCSLALTRFYNNLYYLFDLKLLVFPLKMLNIELPYDSAI